MDIKFPSFESLTDDGIKGENAVDLFRNVSQLINKSSTVDQMRACILRLRQLRKFRVDTFCIALSNDLEEFCQRFMDYEEPAGKEEIIFETMLFFREFVFISSDEKNIKEELFMFAFYDALEPFFHFPQNIQIQNFARECLGLYLSDISSTSTISKTMCSFLTTTDQELTNFWIQKLNEFLAIFDVITLSNYFDWAKIMVDIQGKYNDDLYTPNNLNMIKLFLNQIKSIVQSPEQWIAFENECIAFSLALIEKEKKEFEKELNEAKEKQQKAIAANMKPDPLPVFVQHRKECFLTRDN